MTDTTVPATTVQHFRKHGWAYVPKIFGSGELELLRDVLERAIANPQDADATYGQANERTPPQRAASKQAQEALNVVREPRLFYEELEPLAIHPNLTGPARELLGVDQVRLFSESFLNKPGSGGGSGSRPTPWHQDWPFFPLDRRDELNIWVALDDLEPEQGGLQVVSGSHRLGPLAPPSDFTETPALVDMLRADDVELLQALRSDDDELSAEGVPIRPAAGFEAGDAIIFHGLTLHGAAPNRTDRPRRAYSTVWIDSETRYTGAPYRKTDGVGLTVGKTFDLPRYPLGA